MKPIVLVLSTGRCGTSFLTSALQSLHGERLEAWHERLRVEARSRYYFRRFDDASLDEMRAEPAFASMINSIRATAQTHPYLESGWTLHSFAPLLLREFGDSVRLVFQVRHPFDVAASFAIKGVYRRERRNSLWDRHLFITPEDNVIVRPDQWPHWSAFEKSLWRWAELVEYWDELCTMFPDSVYGVFTAEALFTGSSSLREYSDLLELPTPTESELVRCWEDGRTNATRDELKYWFGLGTEWRSYFAHARVATLAERFGYSSDPAVIRNKARRYAKPLDLLRRTSRRIRQVMGLGN